VKFPRATRHSIRVELTDTDGTIPRTRWGGRHEIGFDSRRLHRCTDSTSTLRNAVESLDNKLGAISRKTLKRRHDDLPS